MIAATAASKTPQRMAAINTGTTYPMVIWRMSVKWMMIASNMVVPPTSAAEYATWRGLATRRWASRKVWIA